MSDAQAQQVDVFTSPGSLLRAERVRRGLDDRDVAEQLNMMPGYVDVLERDAYEELRSPAFARGYVKAYGRLLGLDENALLEAFDEQRRTRGDDSLKRVETRPLQLQRAGAGIVVGLVVLGLFLAGLWWWQGGADSVSTRDEARQVSNED